MTQSVTKEYVMTDSFRELWRRFTEAERNEAGAMLEFYVAQFQDAAATFPDNPMGLAVGIYEALDREIHAHQQRNTRADEITCRKGCSYCCEVHVGITPQEGVLLRAYAKEQGLSVDEALLARQAEATPRTWKELPLVDQRCVFLQANGTCGVYEYRPLACRKYFVISEPILCRTASHSWRWVAAHAEIIATAAYTVFGMGGLAATLMHQGQKDLT